MKSDPKTGIRVLDTTFEYEDGSEDRLYGILAEANDRSSLSDELAEKIDDWPTRYHLSRQRANLVRLLSLDRSMRILEIGAGTGTISRYLGESGASVTALEGNLDRARAAALRCEDLDNVEVICGALEAFEDRDGFDLVCLIGVLEYAGCGKGETAEPVTFLESAARHLRPNGALLVAIENQVGLKYLIGYEEDHLGRPWAGVEGYGEGGGVETFSRRRLGDLLNACNLSNQSWFYPFPDYKHPKAVLSHAAYTEFDAPAFVDQLVRSPVSDATPGRALLCDDRRTHQVMLEAGLGPDIANSFLVIASPDGRDRHPSLPNPSILAWHFGDERRSSWIRHQVVEQTSEGRRIRVVRLSRKNAKLRRKWLGQKPEKDEVFHAGPTLEVLALEACRRGDVDGLTEVLERWRSAIDGHRYGRPSDFRPSNPFSGKVTGDLLPPSFLDVCLSNFVATDDRIEFVDREWEACDAVDADLVMARALWILSRTVIRASGAHPWSSTLSVDELTQELGVLCDLEIDEELLGVWKIAEVELQNLVSGSDPDTVRTDLEWLGSLTPTSRKALDALPYTTVARRIDQLQSEIEQLSTERAVRSQLEEELSRVREQEANLVVELTNAHKLIEEIGSKLEGTPPAFDELQEYNASLVEREKELEAERARQDRKLIDEGKLRARRDQELAAAHQQLEELSGKLEETTRQLSAEREVTVQRTQQLAAARQQLEELGGELEETTRQLSAEREVSVERTQQLAAAHAARRTRRRARGYGARPSCEPGARQYSQ